MANEASKEDMYKMILDYVKKEYTDDGGASVTVDSPLISSGLVDSFSMVSLKLFLENKYQVKIPDEKATPEAFDTVKKITTLVQEFIAKK